MRVAIYQMLVTDNMEHNYLKMVKAVEKAASESADLIVFPESCLTGYLGMNFTNIDALDIREIHEYILKLKKIALKYEIAIVTGQYLKRCGKWFNNLLFIGKNGDVINSYDKCHLIDDDCYHVAPGYPPEIFDYMGTKFMLGVCHDIRYAEHAMNGGINSAQIYINPFYGCRGLDCAADTQKVYDSMLVTRAVENGMYILSPNAVNREQMVRSQIVSPQGKVLKKSESYHEDFLICDIDENLAGYGWVKRRRTDIYTFKVNELPVSYFEKSYREKQYYNVCHNDSMLDQNEIKELF